MSLRRRLFLLFVVIGAVLGYAFFVSKPPGPRDIRAFDPDRVADLELSMWQAYYQKRNAALFRDLVVLTRETYRMTWWQASRMSYHLARAAATFGSARSDYEQVLPDLTAGYTIARDWTSATYDPAVVARAELAWWAARRVPGQDSPEHVGALIADLNALLYRVPKEKVLEASVLRARAGRLRDEGGADTNWFDVERLLRDSYRALHAAVN
jgi:hypothetical protein